MNNRETIEARRQRPGFIVIRNPEGPLERNRAMRIRMQVREKEVKCVVWKFGHKVEQERSGTVFECWVMG
jgi:hypothetical protein